MNWKCFVSKINIAIILLLLSVDNVSAFNVGTDWTNTVKNLYTTGTIVTSNVLGLTNTIDLVTDLRSRTWTITTITKSVQPLGYYVVGDTNPPIYNWTSGAVPGAYVDNGGSIIVPTGGDGSEAWVWNYSGPLNVLWFGATKDTSTSEVKTANRAAIQAAIDDAELTGNSIIINDTFHLQDYTVSNFDAAVFYCLKIDEDNTGVSGNGHLIYDPDGTTNFQTIFLIGDDDAVDSGGDDEESYIYTENNMIEGITVSTNDTVDTYSNATQYVRAGTIRFAKNCIISNTRLEGLFHEGWQYKSYAIGGGMYNNYAKYCTGAAAFNLNGGGVKKVEIAHNDAEFCYQAVEDGGINNNIHDNVSRYNIFGFRYSGFTSLREGATFSNNTALFTGKSPFLVRADQVRNLRFLNNKSQVSGYGAISIYPSSGAIGSWGDTYNEILLQGNVFQDANLVGLTTDSGDGISVYGDHITAIGNEGYPATQDYYYLSVTTGTDLDKIFPLDVLVGSAGGTGVVVGISDVAGADGAQTANVLLMRKTGNLLNTNTITITGKATIAGTLNANAGNTNVPPVGLELLESGTDTCENPYLIGNNFQSATVGTKKGTATITGDFHDNRDIYNTGTFYGGSSGYFQMGVPLRFSTAGDAVHNAPYQGSRYHSLSTTEPITPGSNLRGGIAYVWGEEGTNRFFDLVVFAADGASPETVVTQALTVNGSPQVRTYTVDTSHRLNLAMAANTYDVEVVYFISDSGLN